MGRYNNVSIEAYSSGLTRITDPKNELRKKEGLNFRTYYPGGLYGDASFFVPRKVVNWWELNGAQRIVFRNDLRQCYEGFISNLQSAVDIPQGVDVRLLGPTGHILMNYLICKRWADTRITEDVWEVGTTTTAAEKCTYDRNNRLMFVPKNVQWTSGEAARYIYSMPTGQTVKRITASYDLQEGAQAWALRLYSSTDKISFSLDAAIATASGTGSLDHTLGTPRQYIMVQFENDSGGNQTPADDGSIYGKLTSVTVYSETGSINMEEIAKDIVGIITTLNSDTRFIDAAGSALSLVPFNADTFDNAADVLEQAVSQGDGAYNRWAWMLLNSESAFVPDGKPLLSLNTYLTTSDYEMAVRLDEQNLILPVTISQDFDSIRNWIAVEYTDVNGNRQWRTPDDAAALRDDTSISNYGRRGETVLLPGTSTSTIAEAVGQRYLATYKDPQYRLTSPVTVAGYIRGKGGMIYPASEIRAGYRLRIENYLDGLTFVVTGTSYEDDSETCQITTGVPDAPLLLRYTPPAAVPGAPGSPEPTTPPPAQTTVVRTVTDKMLRRMGLTRAKWAKMTPAQRRRAKKKAGL